MFTVLGIIFFGLIVAVLGLMAWGYLFGNGTASRRNRQPGTRLQSQLLAELNRVIGVDDRDSQPDVTTEDKLALAIVAYGVTNGIFHAGGPFAGHQETIAAHLRTGRYDVRHLTLLVLAYTLAQLSLYQPKQVTRRAVHNLTRDLRLDTAGQAELCQAYDHMAKAAVAAIRTGGPSAAETLLASYVLNPNAPADTTDPMLNLHIQIAYTTQFAAQKDHFLPKAARLLTHYV